jgi:hypothetical protein
MKSISSRRHGASVPRGLVFGVAASTVIARLGLRPAKSLKGQTLSVDIAATDRNGHRQLQPAARSIRVRP